MEILFVCTGNTCRSPIAEGILNNLSSKNGWKLKAKSAGIFAIGGEAISTRAIEAMEEINIDISAYKSKPIESIDMAKIDLVFVMGKSHKNFLMDHYPHMIDRIFLLNEYAFGESKDIEDPFGGDLKKYRSVRDEINRAIMEIGRRDSDDNRYRKRSWRF